MDPFSSKNHQYGFIWFYDDFRESIHSELLDIRSQIQKQALPLQKLFNYSPFVTLVSFKIKIQVQNC